MSIIFKALKKAEEETRGDSSPVKKAQAYHFGSKKLLIIIITGVAVLALSSFAGIYLAKNKTLPKLFAKFSKKAPDAMPRPAPVAPQPSVVTPQPSVVSPQPPKTADAPDAAKFHEDAVKQIKDKKYSEAEGILRKAILAKSDDAVMHNSLGIALKNLGKYRDAVTAYEKALKLKPDYYEAMNNLAVTQEMLGDKKKAKVFYKKALSLKPSYAEAHLNYALLLEAEGDSLTAESHYQQFLALSSDEALKNKVKERLKGIKK
ncbi:MAG: tetratricopeptide repeat protein [Nitrospiraceae bacterium]|nr:MAG: tetratricopeptide repeat protein [Nitrospiraceae bacterium]